MTLTITAVYDKKAEEYMGINASRNAAEAVRNFAYACKNEKSMINAFPEDFALYEIGIFDTGSGKILPKQQPALRAEAVNYINEEKEKKTIK